MGRCGCIYFKTVINYSTKHSPSIIVVSSATVLTLFVHDRQAGLLFPKGGWSIVVFSEWYIYPLPIPSGDLDELAKCVLRMMLEICEDKYVCTDRRALVTHVNLCQALFGKQTGCLVIGDGLSYPIPRVY